MMDDECYNYMTSYNYTMTRFTTTAHHGKGCNYMRTMSYNYTMMRPTVQLQDDDRYKDDKDYNCMVIRVGLR
jgi:hypothetical protein